MSKGNLTLTTIALAGIGMMISGGAIAAEKSESKMAESKMMAKSDAGQASNNHWMHAIGLIQVDQAYVTGTGSEVLSSGHNLYPSGSNIRHAIIGLEGGYGQYGYRVSTNLSRINVGTDPSTADIDYRTNLREAFIHYKPTKEWCVVAGQMNLPMGMENATVDEDRMFMERALPAQAARLTNRITLGALLQLKEYDVNLAFGLYQGETDHATLMTTVPNIPSSEPTGYMARLTWSPSYKAGTIVHLGATMARSDLDKAYGVIQWKATPELRLRRSGLVGDTNTDIAYYSSGVIRHVKSYSISTIEAAAQYDSFTAQAEAFYYEAKRDGLYVSNYVSSKINYHGAYGQLGYVLTGEQRPYDAKRGTFGRVMPRGKMGAFELAIRQSFLDLTQQPDAAQSGSINPAGTGGVIHSTTFGLNYWHDAHFSASFNCVRPIIPVSGQVNTDLGMYGVRVQMVF